MAKIKKNERYLVTIKYANGSIFEDLDITATSEQKAKDKAKEHFGDKGCKIRVKRKK